MRVFAVVACSALVACATSKPAPVATAPATTAPAATTAPSAAILAPVAAPAAATIAGEPPSAARSSAEAQHELDDHRQVALGCFTRELAARPDLAGHVDVDVVVGIDGRIVDAAVADSTVPDDATIRECILTNLRHWQLARRTDATSARVRFPWEAPPVMGPPAPVGHGALDKEMIRLVIRAHLDEIRACYEQKLVAQPTLAGRVMTEFVIAATGVVISSRTQSSTLNQPDVEACMNHVIERWRFPRPAGGGIVIVSYPFILKTVGP